MNLVKPPKLKYGDTIGIISPSSALSPIHQNSIIQNVKLLEKIGFRVEFGPNYSKSYGHKAGTIKDRIDDLHSLFRDKNVNAVISSRGGWNSNELLDKINYDIISENPKIFCGFSDITAMHIAIFAKTNLVTFYGPLAISRLATSGEIGNYTLNSLIKVVSNNKTGELLLPSTSFTYGRHNENELRNQSPTKWITLKDGNAKGTLIGGHISTMLALAGTNYFPDFNDKILFWEDTEGSTAFTNRSLEQLKMLGVFENITGMIIGRIHIDDYKVDAKNYDLFDIVMDCTAGYNFPVIANMDFGHTLPMLTIPYGVKARITANEHMQIFELLEPAVT